MSIQFNPVNFNSGKYVTSTQLTKATNKLVPKSRLDTSFTNTTSSVPVYDTSGTLRSGALVTGNATANSLSCPAITGTATGLITLTGPVQTNLASSTLYSAIFDNTPGTGGSAAFARGLLLRNRGAAANSATCIDFSTYDTLTSDPCARIRADDNTFSSTMKIQLKNTVSGGVLTDKMVIEPTATGAITLTGPVIISNSNNTTLALRRTTNSEPGIAFQNSVGTNEALIIYVSSEAAKPLLLYNGVRKIECGNGTSGIIKLSGPISLTDSVSTYRNVATAANGVPSIHTSSGLTTQTGPVASLATYSVGSTQQELMITGVWYQKSSMAAGLNYLNVNYTPENDSSALTIAFGQVSQLGPSFMTTIIRAKPSTTITLSTTNSNSASMGNYTVSVKVLRLE